KASIRRPSLKFSPDGETFASGGGSAGIRLYNIKTGSLIRTIGGNDFDTKSISFSASGEKISAGGIYGACLYETKTSKQLWIAKSHRRELHGIDSSKVGELLVIAGRHFIKLIDIKNNTTLQ